MRRIIHIDMDAFYASVEERDHPELKGKPLVVGGNPNHRGVVATCNYEARRYGIHSAMSCKKAYALCPKVIFITPRHEHYSQISMQIREIFKRYTKQIEPLSLDEAFLDVTATTACLQDAIEMAKAIKQTIIEEVGLIASAGISYNKFLAKVATDYQKPNGLTCIRKDEAQSLLDELPIEKFFGVGKVTAKELKRIGIIKGKDLRRLDKSYLELVFNKRGEMLYNFARGIDYRIVENSKERKSIGAETTFDRDIDLKSKALHSCIETLADEVGQRMLKHNKKARTLTVKIKFEDFTQITRSVTPNQIIKEVEEITLLTVKVIDKIEDYRKIRLLGMTVSNLLQVDEVIYENLTLFDTI